MSSRRNDVCQIWSPDGAHQPKKNPTPRYTMNPLFPVCIQKLKASIYKRGWFWLWECSICGEEQLEAPTYVERCTCDVKFEKRSLYPCAAETICQHCSTQFTYHKINSCHTAKFCSEECHSEAQRIRSSEQAAIRRLQAPVLQFDRQLICMRFSRNETERCDHYNYCQEQRFEGTLGDLYIPDGSCYTTEKQEEHKRLSIEYIDA